MGKQCSDASNNHATNYGYNRDQDLVVTGALFGLIA
jgi:hypothetical protein